MRKIFILFISVFTLLSCTCLTTFASEQYATPLSNNCDAYVIFKDTNGTVMYIMYNSDDWTLTMSTNSLKWTKHRDTAYVRYYSTTYSNGSWGTLSQLSENRNYYGPFTVLQSNQNIYSSDGSLFFEGAPLEQIVKEEMEKKFHPKVVGEMKILTLCGVGLIALLMGYKLFGKVLPIFRV